MKLQFQASEEELWQIREISSEIPFFAGLEKKNPDETVSVSFGSSEKGIRIEYDGQKAKIFYQTRAGLGRAFGILCEKLRDDDRKTTEENPAFESMTLMHDCSRNAVLRTDYVKKILRRLSLNGFNRMQLYTEDTYEIEGEPFFGYMRGRFTKEELKELDAYADRLGIEMVPCIQTLAHLGRIFRWRPYGPVRDCNDILLCNEKRTYELIEKMIRTCRECFHTGKINIGMDEAEMLGRGNYLKDNPFEDHFPIMMKHLKKVLELCEKYQFRAMMWSDMFFKLLSQGEYYASELSVDESVRRQIPQNVTLVYWDYYSRSEEIYDRMLTNHKKLSDRIAFAGGAWRWNGFAPLLHHSLTVTPMALKSCLSHGIKDVMITAWGDNGSECSTGCIWPVITEAAEICYTGSAEEEKLEKRLYTCSGLHLKDALLLDLANLTPDNPAPGRLGVGPARYLFYQDLLSGIYDKNIDPKTYPKHFSESAGLLEEAENRAGENAYLYDTLAKLCRVLSHKCDLGIRLKEAYDTRNRAALASLTDECGALLPLVQDFHEALAAQWYRENRPFGFEVLDIRIGGVKERIRRAQKTIQAYLSGEIDRIEEFETERLELTGKENAPFATVPVEENIWKYMVSASEV